MGFASGEEFRSVLGAAQAGGDWAFAVLFRTFNPPLSRYFAARAPTEAEDLAAETWMAVARQLASFDGDEPGFRAWLFTIAHRRLVQHWRDRSRRGGSPSGIEAAGGVAADDDPEGDVIADVSAREAARRIAEALSPEQAEVVLLRVLGGLDVDQVAAVLAKRPGSIRVLQHRALKKLASEKFFVEGVTQ